MVDLNKIISAAEGSCRKAGQIIKTSSPSEIKVKSCSDYVTDIDLDCQNVIKNTVLSEFPGHSFLAEEDGNDFSESDDLWIIDPLDGTTNFIHGLAHSAVSVAYYTKGDLLAGAIYDPYSDEMFTAVKGRGAFLNGSPVTVSGQNEMKRGLIATGMPFRRHEKIPPYFDCLADVLKNSSGIRRMGCASLDLAYTACGRFEGFFEGWLSAWDIAAGILIVEEAGGRVSDFSGGKNCLKSGCIIAASCHIYPGLYKIVNKHLKGKQ
ncbi:MAG TPA: inositol monophosphatase family protein [Clostridiales bacterium]|nr:inositol monophosphatase family protein [Clostridiales bacterium]HQP69073.1 inositol monophosphatase family protein [Clostridiales bacterium]